MGAWTETINGGLQVSIMLAEKLMKDIPHEMYARKIRAGEACVEAVHPAFVFGHLSLYPQKAAQLLGAETPEVVPPEGFEELFKAGAECRDDPEGEIYPPAEEINAAFFRVHRALQWVVEGADDATLERPTPEGAPLKQAFATVGGLVTFLVTSHPMMHLGQVSTWRRCHGLGSAM